MVFVKCFIFWYEWCLSSVLYFGMNGVCQCLLFWYEWCLSSVLYFGMNGVCQVFYILV